jgi:hypothetical protein
MNERVGEDSKEVKLEKNDWWSEIENLIGNLRSFKGDFSISRLRQ